MTTATLKPIKLFALSFFIVLAVTAAVAVMITLAMVQTTTERGGAVGSLLQGTLGAAIALAGSIVAIVIANNANNAILLQTHRESADLINQRFETAVNAINAIAQSLSNAYTAWIVSEPTRERLLKRLTELDDWQEYAQNGDILLSPDEVKQKLREGLSVSPIQELLPVEVGDLTTWKDSMTDLSDAIIRLAAALETVCQNSYSLLLWQKQDSRPTCLSLIPESIPGFIRLSVAKSPLEVASLLRSCAKRLVGPLTMRAIVEPRISASLGSRGRKGSGPTDLLELGAAIFRLDLPRAQDELDDAQREADESLGFINVGVCFLVDLLRQLPTPEMCQRTASELFDGLLPKEQMETLPILRIIKEFSPRSWVNERLFVAVKSYVQAECHPIVQYSKVD